MTITQVKVFEDLERVQAYEELLQSVGAGYNRTQLPSGNYQVELKSKIFGLRDDHEIFKADC